MSKSKRGKHPNSLKNLKLFEKGKSGNPKGRPTGSKDFRKVMQALLNMDVKVGFIDEDIDATTAMAVHLRNTALSESEDRRVVLKAMEMILDRMYGKPAQYIEQKEVPTTAEDAIKNLEVIAQQEGISLEDLCDREGISL